MPDIKDHLHQFQPDSNHANQNWLQLWRDQEQSGFHMPGVNPLLSKFWSKLKLTQQHRVLVPLCGKSRDILWLAEQGHDVVGIELSPIAVEDFFKENHLKAKKQRIGNFIRWRAGKISIWCGDFFSLATTQLGRIDAVFDRAALTALSPDIRGAYIKQLINLTAEDALVLLFTVEDIRSDSTQVSSPIDQELDDLCEGSYTIRLLHTEPILINDNNHDKSIVSYSKIYQLDKYNS